MNDTTWDLVCVESPFAAESESDFHRNIAYAEAAMLDAIERGEAPYLSHLLYPRVLKDSAPADRACGLSMAQAWLVRSDKVAVYTDLGVSNGMQAAIRVAKAAGIPVEYRSIQ